MIENRKVKKERDRESADVENGESKANSENRPRRKFSKQERELLAKKLHARLHFGKTSHTLNALKNAYGVGFEFACDLPCDACQWAKAKHKTTPKANTRKAVRVGECLHYDI